MKNKLSKILAIVIVITMIWANICYQVKAVEEGGNQESGTTENTEGNTGGGQTTTEEPETPATPSEEDPKESAQPQTDNPSGGSTQTTTTNNKQTSTTPTRSSNANLSNLGIRPNDFTGFTPSQTTYNVTVPNDVDSVEVYATAQNANATISGTGTKSLQEGNNALMVTVTAQNGTKKTYTINVTRQTSEESEENSEEANATEQAEGLEKIEIAGATLSPEFQTNIYEYTAKYIGEETNLNVDAVATNSDYTVEVTGNDDLKEGENLITILVTDAEGENVATYQITLNKSLVDEEAIAREQEELERQETQRKMIAAGIAIIFVIIVIVVIIIIKRRKNRMLAEDYSGIPFSGLNDDEYDDGYAENYLEGEEGPGPLEDFDQNMNYQANEDIEQENELDEKDIEQIEPTDDAKARIREEFLNNYKFDDYDEEEMLKRKSKGKRSK